MSDQADGSDPVPPARIEVVEGGRPSDEQLAALTIALTPTAGAQHPPTVGDGIPAWARAALLEGVGARTPTRPSDLDAVTRFG